MPFVLKKMSHTPEIITFGCRLNTYESEVIRAHAQAAGLGEVIIFNTCAVTGEAERQAGQAIRKARREHPAAKIIVTGCAAQISPEKYAAMPEVDLVIGNEGKLKAETYAALAEQADGKIHVTDIQQVRETASHLVQGFEGKSRAFVQVQNGCNHRCTFCIIPYGRGPSRSVSLDRIVEQVGLLVAEGYNEVALTGVDITSYGADLPEPLSLGAMIARLLAAVPGLRHLRLSSLDPMEIDEALWALIAQEPRLMPHLHLSLQAGDDMVLKRMKRRHARKDIYDLAAKARALRPEVVFGADIIAGFPTETDEMFANTLALVEELDFTWLHVFPYSARTGTPAAKMPQVKKEIRKQRAALLREAGDRAIHRHIDGLIGRKLDVLVEKPDLGRTPTFAETRLLTPAVVGAITRVEIVGREGERALARPI